MKVGVVGAGALADAVVDRLRAAELQVVLADEDALRDVDLVVWAREGVAAAVAMAANEALLRAGRPAIFVLTERDAVAVGPLTVPGRTACLECSMRVASGRHDVGRATPDLAVRAAAIVLAMLGRLRSGAPGAASPACERTWTTMDGSSRTRAVWPRTDCPACAAALVSPGPFGLAAAMALLGSPPRMASADSLEDGGVTRRVGVIGGGTAGYLTAIALRRMRPSLEVTLVESSRIPVIGVGEATTPDLVAFLHRTLGIDELELYREVAPTWKLGIRFLWGPEGHSFHHPFSGRHLLEALAHRGDPELQSLSTQLMARGLAPMLRDDHGRIVPLFDSAPYAYHLDNRRFVAFLQRVAARERVAHVDCVVQRAKLGPDGSVECLLTEDGRTLAFDFYVDATGFHGLLLGEALGVPYRSYASTLFADSAVMADLPARADIDPFTLAETMDAGWCWNIPQVDGNHRGYVFSSRFLSVDQAEAEMRAANPGMGEARSLRFRSGRLESSWVKNVFGVGNAYAFVEPLESTALHMLTHQIDLLVGSLSFGAIEVTDAARSRVNRAVAAHWDCLRGFLALHYRFNRRKSTPFWRACNEEVDLAQGEEMLAAFRAGAPLSARADRHLLEDSLLRTGYFGLLGIDNVLLGQKVPTTVLAPRGDGGAFDRWVRHGLPEILARALPHREGLEAYVESLRRWR